MEEREIQSKGVGVLLSDLRTEKKKKKMCANVPKNNEALKKVTTKILVAEKQVKNRYGVSQ